MMQCLVGREAGNILMSHEKLFNRLSHDEVT